MKGQLGDKERLWHILEAINSIESFCQGIDEEDFQNNYMLQLAVVKLLEVMGEASTRITKELRNEFSQIEWPLIIKSRNVLVHEYFAINYDIIWEAVQNDLPNLKNNLKEILRQKFGESV